MPTGTALAQTWSPAQQPSYGLAQANDPARGYVQQAYFVQPAAPATQYQQPAVATSQAPQPRQQVIYASYSSYPASY